MVNGACTKVMLCSSARKFDARYGPNGSIQLAVQIFYVHVQVKQIRTSSLSVKEVYLFSDAYRASPLHAQKPKGPILETAVVAASRSAADVVEMTAAAAARRMAVNMAEAMVSPKHHHNLQLCTSRRRWRLKGLRKRRRQRRGMRRAIHSELFGACVNHYVHYDLSKSDAQEPICVPHSTCSGAKQFTSALFR